MDNILDKRWERILSLSTKLPEEIDPESEEGKKHKNLQLLKCLNKLKLDKDFVEKNIQYK